MSPATAMSAERDRAMAVLALSTEAALRGLHAPPPPGVLVHPWSAWWICYRAASHSARAIGPALRKGACAVCERNLHRLTVGRAPGHPDHSEAKVCAHYSQWAQLWRSSRTGLTWPAQRLTLGLIKPGGPQRAITTDLAAAYTILASFERRLSVADVRRLYPEAYGSDYVTRRDTYYTSAPVRVLVLLAGPGAPETSRVKAQIRERFATDSLRNCLHMPDNPGETWCDLEHLAGHQTLTELYGRWEREHAQDRMDFYRTVLGGHPAHLDRQRSA